MTTLTYTLIFLGVLCVGTCLGWLIAGIIRITNPNYDTAIKQLKEENERLSKDNSELVNKLWEIEEVVKKYFGPGVG